MRLSFEDALAGAQVRVPVEVDTPATSVAERAPSRARPRSPARSATAPARSPTRHGLFALSQPCPRCRGNGVIVENACKNCRGTGRERVTKRYQVKVPAGRQGRHADAPEGQGRAGARTAAPRAISSSSSQVDAVAALRAARRRPRARGAASPIPEAALGATVQIPTPDGPVNLKVPAGSESGKLLRVKGRGAPKLNGGGKGDLLARIKVTVPQKLSKTEKEALEGYHKVLRERPRERAFA